MTVRPTVRRCVEADLELLETLDQWVPHEPLGAEPAPAGAGGEG